MPSLEEHEYEGLVLWYETTKRKWKGDAAHWLTYAIALLCLGKIDDSLHALEKHSELLMADDIRGMDPFHPLYGTALALTRPNDLAIAHLKTGIEGLKKRRIRYTDPSGGALNGLLLWTASKLAQDEDSARHAIKYLQSVIKTQSKWEAVYPLQAAIYLVGKSSEIELLTAACGTASREAIADIPSHEGQRLDAAMHALFYVAFKKRFIDGEKSWREDLKLCASLENVHGFGEWYIARRELGLDFHWKPSDRIYQ